MAVVQTFDLDETTRRLVLSSGMTLTLELSLEKVRVLDGDGQEVGYLSFTCKDVPFGCGDVMQVYRLTHAFIEGGNGRYKHQGVGTEAVRFFQEYIGQGVELPKDDGVRKDDGSHLTGDGPGFVGSLRRKRARGEL